MKIKGTRRLKKDSNLDVHQENNLQLLSKSSWILSGTNVQISKEAEKEAGVRTEEDDVTGEQTEKSNTSKHKVKKERKDTLVGETSQVSTTGVEILKRREQEISTEYN